VLHKANIHLAKRTIIKTSQEARKIVYEITSACHEGNDLMKKRPSLINLNSDASKMNISVLPNSSSPLAMPLIQSPGCLA
jgi:hypothetical protein